MHGRRKEPGIRTSHVTFYKSVRVSEWHGVGGATTMKTIQRRASSAETLKLYKIEILVQVFDIRFARHFSRATNSSCPRSGRRYLWNALRQKRTNISRVVCETRRNSSSRHSRFNPENDWTISSRCYLCLFHRSKGTYRSRRDPTIKYLQDWRVSRRVALASISTRASCDKHFATIILRDKTFLTVSVDKSDS